jgi:catechol 2,3-dioxygenase-like lactoylglutathione lyase family enzyme
MTPSLLVEVITLPVSDADRALRFYVDQVGFALDVDYAATDAFRVVQLTPAGSSCSIQLGIGPHGRPGRVSPRHLPCRDRPRNRPSGPAGPRSAYA